MACVVATKYVEDFSRICVLAETLSDPERAVDQVMVDPVAPSFVCMADIK